jgi:hypothetical protein
LTFGDEAETYTVFSLIPSRLISLLCLLELLPSSLWYYVFPLWLYSPILCLGRLHKTFRFISVTRSRIVSRTPWTGDQLVASPLLTAPGDCDDGEVVGMNGFGRGTEVLGENLSRRHFVHNKSHLPDPGANPGRRGGKPATNRFSYGAAHGIMLPRCILTSSA